MENNHIMVDLNKEMGQQNEMDGYSKIDVYNPELIKEIICSLL